jgi:hypothetical protein
VKRHYLREEDKEAQDFDVNKCTSDRCKKSTSRPLVENLLPLLQWYTRKAEDERPFLTETKRSTKQQGTQLSGQQP